MNNEDITLKDEVKDYWNQQACGTQFTDKDKYTLEYFEEIESNRYKVSPEIFSFAQFTRFRDKKVLEIGVGAGTDFLQWVRAGASAYGIDLTEEAIEHVKHRLSLYNLKASGYAVADSENLPFEEDTFDLVYTWGVIHHSPNTLKALDEIIRVLKPGGSAKIMIYNRHSLLSYFFWIKHALLKGKPFKSLADILWYNMESIGTKAYTPKEVEKILLERNVNIIEIKPVLSYYDRLERFNPMLRCIASVASKVMGGDRVGWFLTFQFTKK